MHRSVLENATYAAFAAKHTVEMLVTEEMDRALQEKSPLIKTYEGQDPYGDVAEYLVHFPGVTLDQLRALSNSAAVNYIAPAKKIPYTAIVDPHTLKEMEGFTGIYRPDDLIGKIRKHAKTLVLKHGEGIDRKLWNRVTEHEVQVDMLLGQEKIVEAMAVYQSLSRETFRQPKAILNRVTAVQESILADAKERLAAMEKEAATQKTATLKRDAGRLARVLKDTPLEEQANALLEKLK